MIDVKEFDKKFDNGENVDKYLDLKNPLKLEELVDEKITLSIPKVLKNKILEISKKLNLSVEDTIKVLIAKEVGVL